MSTPAPVWTPFEVAAYDQLMAGTSDDLDKLAEILRRLSDRGEQQADADLLVFLMTDYPPPALAALVVAALRRAAREVTS